MNRFIYIALLLVLVLSGCLTDPDCVTATENFVTANFYDAVTNERDTLFVTSVTAIGSDSVLAANREIRGIRLPLNPSEPSTTFVFATSFSSDTLVLTYNLGTRLISEDCGLEFVFTGLGYERSDFDSVTIVNEVPIEGITEDIRIYN